MIMIFVLYLYKSLHEDKNNIISFVKPIGRHSPFIAEDKSDSRLQQLEEYFSIYRGTVRSKLGHNYIIRCTEMYSRSKYWTANKIL